MPQKQAKTLIENKPKENSTVFVWSFSKGQTWMDCKERFFYEYLAKFSKSTPVEKINYFKKMETFAIVTGLLAHNTIERILSAVKDGGPIPEEKELRAYLKEKMDEYKNAPFFETHYKAWRAINFFVLQDNVIKIVDNFLQHPFVTKMILSASPEEKKTWLIEDNSDIITTETGDRARLILDFAFKKGDTLYIIDWKTGSPSPKVETQMLSYSQHPKVTEMAKTVKQIKTVGVYLRFLNVVKEFDVVPQKVEKILKQIHKTVEDMKTFFVDIEHGIPKDEKYFFTYSGDKPQYCTSCKYQEICSRQP